MGRSGGCIVGNSCHISVGCNSVPSSLGHSRPRTTETKPKRIPFVCSCSFHYPRFENRDGFNRLCKNLLLALAQGLLLSQTIREILLIGHRIWFISDDCPKKLGTISAKCVSATLSSIAQKWKRVTTSVFEFRRTWVFFSCWKLSLICLQQ